MFVLLVMTYKNATLCGGSNKLVFCAKDIHFEAVLLFTALC